jgi:hypothetical protein
MEIDLILETVRQYFAAWNTESASERSNLLEECFAATGTYVDPHAGVKNGIAQMKELIDTFRSKFPHRLERTGNVDTDNNIFQVPWRLIDETAGVLSSGLFSGELDTSARIMRLTVTLDEAK